MSIKKALSLAPMALAALAFAAPTVASAEWTHEGEPLAGDITLSAAGTAEFNVDMLGGVQCENATASFVVEDGTSTGYVESFVADTDSACHGNGLLTGCTVEKTALTDASGNPGDKPTLHTTENDIKITDVRLWAEYSDTKGHATECQVKETELLFLSANGDYITVDVDPNKNQIETLTLTAPSEQGAIFIVFGFELPGVKVDGDLTIEDNCTLLPSTLTTGCDGTFGFG